MCVQHKDLFLPESYFGQDGGYLFLKFDSKNGELWMSCHSCADPNSYHQKWNDLDWKFINQKDSSIFKIVDRIGCERFLFCANTWFEKDSVKIIDSKIVENLM